MSEYYWELVLRDGTKYDIPPAAVPVVKRRMEAHDPINLKTASIPYAQIEHFRITSKAFDTQPLLEAASQAFNEPIYTEDGSIQARWVKKLVTQREYSKAYTHGYRRLGDENGMVVVAWRQPLHSIDNSVTQDCDEGEVQKLESNQNKY